MSLATNPLSLSSYRKIPVSEVSMTLMASLMLPYLTSQLPYAGNIPLDLQLIGMFVGPLLGVIWFQFRVALIAALLAPALTYMTTGAPEISMMLLLTLQLIIFACGLAFLWPRLVFSWLSAPVSFLIAILISSSIASILAVEQKLLLLAFHTLNTVWPGLAALTVLAMLSDKFSFPR